MKKYQKNPIYPSVPFSCMVEQLLSSVLDKSNKWHLNNHIWSLNLNLWFKPISFKSLLVALAQINSILPCHDHTSCVLHCIDCVPCCLPVLFLLGKRRFWRSDRWHRWSAVSSSEVPGKQPPLEHSDTIPLFAPTLFYCIRTTMIQLLHVSVVEPIPLHDLSLPQ